MCLYIAVIQYLLKNFDTNMCKLSCLFRINIYSIGRLLHIIINEKIKMVYMGLLQNTEYISIAPSIRIFNDCQLFWSIQCNEMNMTDTENKRKTQTLNTFNLNKPVWVYTIRKGPLACHALDRWFAHTLKYDLVNVRIRVCELVKRLGVTWTYIYM